MKALFITAPGRTQIREIPEPDMKDDEVLLRLMFVAYCGSDLNTFRGKNPMVTLPRIPGHELAAVIEKCGEKVPDSFRPGMKVTVSPYTNCGQCPSCRHGRPNACQFNQTMGVQRDGALTEHISVPWGKIYSSEKLSLKELALVEPLAVGFHASARGAVTEKDTVAVLGCGAIGLGAISGSAWRKAKVIAVDIDDAKLEIAREAGAALTINSARQNLHEELQKTTGDGPDVIIEAIGLPATFKMAVDEVAFSGRIVYVGYAKEPVSYETKYFVQKELDIRGSRNALGDFSDVITMLEEGKFPVDSVITEIFPFEKSGAALEKWDANPAAVTRFLIDLE